MARAATTADVFNAIAEPRRRQVIAVLADGREYAVGEVVARMRMSQPAVSKHLGVLRKVGVVSVIKRGQHRMYRLNAAKLKPVHDWVKTFERYWTHQLGQIKERAERKALERMISSDIIKEGGLMAANIQEQATQAVQTFEIVKQEEIAAPIGIVFETILEQMGPLNSTPEKPMPMKLEAWPGGRWFRDLGNNTGHFWGVVQAIKPPSLLEICGPLFMSTPAVSNHPVPADRRERIDAATVCASGDGVDRRIGPRSGCRLDRPDDPDSHCGIKTWQQTAERTTSNEKENLCVLRVLQPWPGSPQAPSRRAAFPRWS